jgi:cyclopropane fatty-acyl-phospholipid synthase-like methyltransferase
MKEQEFYQKLAKGRYLAEARRFIPPYDKMIKIIVDLLKKHFSKNILDIGSGVGNVEEEILQNIPNAKITGVEVSSGMAKASQEKLKKYSKKANIINQDISTFKPTEKYDAVFSNIVIHNLPLDKKKELIKRVKTWLKPDGIFIWGDLIKYKDKKTQEKFIKYRWKLALERGATEEFAKENFKKEEKHDHPLTIEETSDLLRENSFKNVKNILTQDTFTVFYCKK